MSVGSVERVYGIGGRRRSRRFARLVVRTGEKLRQTLERLISVGAEFDRVHNAFLNESDVSESVIYAKSIYGEFLRICISVHLD